MDADQSIYTYSYEEWQDAQDKGNPRYYDDEQFREDYTKDQIDSKAEMFKRFALADVKTALANWRRVGKTTIRVLSLGCGPGSDLLGLLAALSAAVKSESRRHSDAVALECSYIGVDAFDWDFEFLEDRLSRLRESVIRDSIHVSHEFVTQDMEEYVQENDQEEFDFICLCFASAGAYLNLVGAKLPQLLSEFGRILVLDVNTDSVRRLVQYGYKCKFSDESICMHSRGQEKRGLPYEPSENSPIKAYLRNNGRGTSQCEQCSIL